MRQGLSASSAGVVFLLFWGAVVGVSVTGAQEEGFDIQEKCNNDFRIATEYWRNRQIPDAHELFTTVVEACPEYVPAYEFKGRCESDMKQYDEAIRTFRDGLDVDPDNVPIRVYLAYALFRNNQFDQVVDVYRSLLEDDPENVDYWIRMADASQRLGNGPDAIMAASQALTVRADSLGLWKSLDHYLLFNRLIVPSIQTSERVYLKEPGDVEVMSRLGAAYGKIQNPEKAVTVYEEIYNLVFPKDGGEGVPFDQKRAADLWQYATVLKKVKDFDKATQIFEKVLQHEAYANDASAWVNLAFLYKDAKRYEDCIRCARRALEIDSKSCMAMCALGKGVEGQALGLEKEKRYDDSVQKIMEARHQFQSATTICPSGTWNQYATAEISRMDEHLTRLNQRKASAD